MENMTDMTTVYTTYSQQYINFLRSISIKHYVFKINLKIDDVHMSEELVDRFCKGNNQQTRNGSGDLKIS